MSNKIPQRPELKLSYKGLGMAIGLVFGGFIGLLIEDPIIFAGGGLVLGLAIGSAVDNRRKHDSS